MSEVNPPRMYQTEFVCDSCGKTFTAAIPRVGADTNGPVMYSDTLMEKISSEMHTIRMCWECNPDLKKLVESGQKIGISVGTKPKRR